MKINYIEVIAIGSLIPEYRDPYTYEKVECTCPVPSVMDYGIRAICRVCPIHGEFNNPSAWR